MISNHNLNYNYCSLNSDNGSLLRLKLHLSIYLEDTIRTEMIYTRCSGVTAP